MQIPRYKSHPWCSSSNAICPRMVCKTQWESQDSTAEQLPFDQRWRNHSTAVCRHWVATHHRIATHQRIATRYCRTHCLDAAVAMHKASQHMKKTIAQNQQRKEKVTWNHQFHCGRKTNRNRRQSGRPQASRVSQLFSATEAPFTQKNNVWCKSQDIKSHPQCSISNAICQEWLAKHNENRKTVLQSSYLSTSVDATIPLRSADTELQHTVELQHTTVEHIAWMQQFQCTKPLNTCKHNSTASTKKRKGHLEPSVPLRVQNEQESAAKRTPASVARARANFSPQRKLRLPKKTMFGANPNIQSHPWCSSSNAICQEWLAKHNQNRKTVLQSSYLSTSVDATIPLRSADTELQHTVELQHTTVEHIAWMQQFQRTKPLNTCKTQ